MIGRAAEALMNLIAGMDGWTIMAAGFLTTVGVGELKCALSLGLDEDKKATADGAGDPAPANNRKTPVANELWGSRRLYRVWRAARFVALLAGLVEVCVIGLMLVWLATSANGPHGSTVAISEDVKRTLPQHFKGLQQVMAATGSWYHNPHAREYFEAQKPLFEESAANLKVHRYFSTLQLPDRITWDNMLHERIKAFAHLLETEGRDDYRVEKDRCAMYKFFQQNNLPVANVLGEWRSRDAFVEALQGGEVSKLAGDSEWPIFFKACHLTQSSSRGTLIIKDQEKLSAGIEDKSLVDWVDLKWAFRAHDFERVWVREGDMLTNAIQPGILMQGAFKQPGHQWEVHGRFAVGLLEFRVEVIWGRAYMAQLDGCVLFFRDGVIEDYSTVWGFLSIPASSNEDMAWIQDEGYMDCIWKLAEKSARQTATENLRVDIFMQRGSPQGCKVNENSLSSGLLYWGHESYLAETWAAGHREKTYQVLDTDKPVYDLKPVDTAASAPSKPAKTAVGQMNK